LLDNFQDNLAGLHYFLSFFSENEVIGILQFPLFITKEKKKLLNLGILKFPLHLVDPKTGKPGKITKMWINSILRESPL
jgi:hypothetical protein